jgi:hypothetical protein
MWAGNLFQRSLDRLLLICLRTHLAPKREDNYMTLVKRKVEEAKKAKQERQKTPSRGSLWQKIRKEKKYLNKCNLRAAGESYGSDAYSKWTGRASLC